MKTRIYKFRCEKRNNRTELIRQLNISFRFFLIILTACLLLPTCKEKSNPVDEGKKSQAGIIVWESAGLSDTRVNDILVISDSRVLAGTEMRGLCQTENSGADWTSMSLTIPVSVIVRNSAGHLFAGRGFGVGVYRSTDNGATWQAANNGLTNKDVFDLAFDGSGALYAATGSGVFSSNDNAATWNRTGLTSPSIYELAIDKDNHVFAGGYKCLERSTDGGVSWTDLNTGTSASFMALAIDDEGHLFAGSGSGGIILRSTDDGDHWTRIDNELTPTNINVLLARSSDEILGGTLDGIIRSTDHGATWAYADSGLTNMSIYCLVSSPTGKVYAGSNKGLFRTQ